PDVVAVGSELGRDVLLDRHHQLHARDQLLGGEVEEVGDVAERDDQVVAGAQREGVARRIGEGVLPRDVARRAEGAGGVGIAPLTRGPGPRRGAGRASGTARGRAWSTARTPAGSRSAAGGRSTSDRPGAGRPAGATGSRTR